MKAVSMRPLCPLSMAAYLLLSLHCTEEPSDSSAQGLTPKPIASTSVSPSAAKVFQREETCLGTRCTLLAYHADPAVVEQGFVKALAEVSRLDRLMTTWLPDSDVSRVNIAAGNGKPIAISAETLEVMEKSLWVAELSAGAFDVTVGAFRGLWKFDEDNDGSLPSLQAVAKRVALVNYRDLLLTKNPPTARLRHSGQLITLGGIAKGWIVDRAVAVLRHAGVANFVFRAGGDLYASGKKGERAWRVGIQDPRASSQAPGDASFALLELTDSAFNTSGDYERFVIAEGRRYHHILEPKSGQPVAHTRSVTVLASTAFLADTLDTALFVMGAQAALPVVEKLENVEAVFVDSHNRVHTSSGLGDRLNILRAPTDGI